MNWWDKFLMGRVMWIMQRWFKHCVVAYNKNKDVTGISFYSDEFNPSDPDTDFQNYDAK